MFDLSLDVAEASLKPFLGEFYTDRVRDLGSMMDAMEIGDFETIEKLAHQWKGFCKPYGFGWLGTKSLSIMLHAKQEKRRELMEDLLLVGQYLDLKKESL